MGHIHKRYKSLVLKGIEFAEMNIATTLYSEIWDLPRFADFFLIKSGHDTFSTLYLKGDIFNKVNNNDIIE